MGGSLNSSHLGLISTLERVLLTRVKDSSSPQEPTTHTLAKYGVVTGTIHFGPDWTTNRAWWSNLANHWEEGN
jgi:hypothetical protein